MSQPNQTKDHNPKLGDKFFIVFEIECEVEVGETLMDGAIATSKGLFWAHPANATAPRMLIRMGEWWHNAKLE